MLQYFGSRKRDYTIIKSLQMTDECGLTILVKINQPALQNQMAVFAMGLPVILQCIYFPNHTLAHLYMKFSACLRVPMSWTMA